MCLKIALSDPLAWPRVRCGGDVQVAGPNVVLLGSSQLEPRRRISRRLGYRRLNCVGALDQDHHEVEAFPPLLKAVSAALANLPTVTL